MTIHPPTAEMLKSQAKRLRADLASKGNAITHAASLEMVAHQWGARDWNTLSAQSQTHSPAKGWTPGNRVSGRYLAQPFTGTVKAARLSGSGMWTLTIRFDAAVDVVTSTLFSNMRRQITAVVDAQGVSPRKTSDGQAHLVLDAS